MEACNDHLGIDVAIVCAPLEFQQRWSSPEQVRGP